MSGLSPARSPSALHGTDPSERSAREAGEAGDPARAAKQLEAFFLRRMLAEVRPEGGMLDGGFAGSTFREMLDEALADKMADSGGIGLAAMIRPELERAAGGSSEEARPSPAAPHAALSLTRTRAVSAYRATTSLLPADDPGMPQPELRAPPVAGRLTSGFGRRTNPIEGDVRTHAGVDIAAPEGTAVRAAGDGTVVRSGGAGGYGNLVVVDHGGGLQTRYGHLSRIDVKAGQRVEAGAPLGAVGQTGRATGPHLHFEVRRDGAAVDPSGPGGPSVGPSVGPGGVWGSRKKNARHPSTRANCGRTGSAEDDDDAHPRS